MASNHNIIFHGGTYLVYFCDFVQLGSIQDKFFFIV